MSVRFFRILTFAALCYISSTNYIDPNDIPELKYMNRSADPCEDFYEYACGNFENVSPRPENLQMWDNFVILRQKMTNLFQEILSSPIRRNDPRSLKMTRAAYKACMDVRYADKLYVPELDVLRNAGSWPLLTDKDDFSWNAVGDLIATYGVQLFFQIEVTPNIYDANENIIYIMRDRILNPNIHPEFLDNSEDFLNLPIYTRSSVHPYETFVSKVALHLQQHIESIKDEKIIRKEISEIFEFFKVIQKGGMTSNKHNQRFVMQTISELQKWTDDEIGTEINLNWLQYFNRIYSKTSVKVTENTMVLIMETSTFYGVLNLIKHTDKKMLKNFVLTRILTYTAPDSNNVIRNAYQQFRKDMGDTIYSRSEYCVRKVLDNDYTGFSFALTYEYQLRHFDTKKLANALEMMEDLYTAFDDILHRSDWLDDETRASALVKAEKMITLLGFPNFVANTTLLNKYYENVRICKWDHFGNSQRIRAFRLASNLALLGKPRNRKIWQKSPLDVNAYYNAQHNRIIVPISILNPGFYNGTIRVLDYGRIGSILGHEITHGFDSQGMYYDGDGSFSPGWWSEKTLEEFEKRTQCFKDQYGSYYIPEIDQYVNGVTTLRENLADNGGLREAYMALQKQLGRSSILLETVEDFTPEQLFFIGFGTMWCTSQTKEYLIKIQGSSYPPAKFRIIGSISNNDDFAKAFNCPVGSKMNPKDKCILW